MLKITKTPAPLAQTLHKFGYRDVRRVKTTTKQTKLLRLLALLTEG
jgi:hypothetical protein